MRARLEIHIKSCSFDGFLCIFESLDLRMVFPVNLMIAFADVPILFHDDTAYFRIGTDSIIGLGSQFQTIIHPIFMIHRFTSNKKTP